MSSQEIPAPETHDPTQVLSNEIENLKISPADPREKLRFWLGKILKIKITDQRIFVGCFVCTDRDANVILENSWEYSTSEENDSEEPRSMGLVLVPGKHIVSIELMK